MAEAALKILERDPRPETLEKVLAVQQKWESDQARKAFTRALIGLKRDLPSIIGKDQVVDFKNKKGQRTYYTHTSLAAVSDAVDDYLVAHGFSLNWIPSNTERLVTVTGRLTHCDGHFEETTLSSIPDTSGSKGPAQAIGSTITYLERYTKLALLGISTADMKEPHGTRDDDKHPPTNVDQDANLRASTWLRKSGRDVQNVEEKFGRLVKDWTASDLVIIRQWKEDDRIAGEAAKKSPASNGDKPGSIHDNKPPSDWEPSQGTGNLFPDDDNRNPEGD
jgi:hypothetical protein